MHFRGMLSLTAPYRFTTRPSHRNPGRLVNAHSAKRLRESWRKFATLSLAIVLIHGSSQASWRIWYVGTTRRILIGAQRRWARPDSSIDVIRRSLHRIASRMIDDCRQSHTDCRAAGLQMEIKSFGIRE